MGERAPAIGFGSGERLGDDLTTKLNIVDLNFPLDFEFPPSRSSSQRSD